jgi:hypothetical protein
MASAALAAACACRTRAQARRVWRQALVVQAEGKTREAAWQTWHTPSMSLGGINEAGSARELTQAEPCEADDVESHMARLGAKWGDVVFCIMLSLPKR